MDLIWKFWGADFHNLEFDVDIIFQCFHKSFGMWHEFLDSKIFGWFEGWKSEKRKDTTVGEIQLQSGLVNRGHPTKLLLPRSITQPEGSNASPTQTEGIPTGEINDTKKVPEERTDNSAGFVLWTLSAKEKSKS